MAVLNTSEAIASRFLPYIGELREVLGQHGIRFGSAEDLAAIADRLAVSGGLAEDVSSILRSVILREGGSLPYTELFEILLVAVAGGEFDPAVEESQPGFRRLLSFAGSVARRPWNMPPGDEIRTDKENSETSERESAGDERLQAEALFTEAKKQPRVVEEPVEDSSAPLFQSGSAMAAALAALPSLAVRREDAAWEQFEPTIRRWEDEEEGRAEAERALDADRDRNEMSETLPPMLPPPPAGSSAPLWIGAGCAVALIFALTMWTRWLYTPHVRHVDAAVLPATGGQSSQMVSSAVSGPTAVALAAAPGISAAGVVVVRKHVTDKDDVADESYRPSRRVVPQPRPAAVRAAAPIVREALPVRTAVPRGEDVMAGGTAGKVANEETAAMPPPPQPWGRMPLPGHSETEESPYVQVSSGVMASHLLLSPDPGYPALAKLTHIRGEVILDAVISSDGEVVATRVLSGHRLLRGAAVSAVKRRKYRPYVLDGRPIDVSTIVTVDFRERR